MQQPASPIINAAHQDPLAQLKDIHMPAPPGSWPPAPGWFILAALGAVVAVAVTWWLFRRWKNNRYRREGMRELDNLLSRFQEEEDRTAYLASYAALLKRIALTRYPRETVANLTAEAWVDFLDKSAQTDEFSMGAGQVLIAGNYRPLDGNSMIDVPKLHDLGKHWIKRHGDLPQAEPAP
jgi:hypothetical protein